MTIQYLMMDTETIPSAQAHREGSSRVWLWGMMNLTGQMEYGLTMANFVKTLQKKGGFFRGYFHNAKYDFSYIMTYLLEENFENITAEISAYKMENPDDDEVKSGLPLGKMPINSFSTVIKDGEIYSITVRFGEYVWVDFRNSLHLYPGSIEELGKGVHVKKLVGDLDYHMERPIGYTPTKKELMYLYNDLDVMRHLFTKEFGVIEGASKSGKTKFKTLEKTPGFTRVSEEYTKMMKWVEEKYPGYTKKKYPKTPAKEYLQMSKYYYGGIVYVKPDIRGKEIKIKNGFGHSIDFNSSYAATMAQDPMVKGKPTIEKNPDHEPEGLTGAKDLMKLMWLGTMKNMKFKLKKNHIASLPKKLTSEYDIITEKDLKIGPTLALPGIDWYHFFQNYDLISGTWTELVTFDVDRKAPYSEYMEKMYNNKIKAKKKYGSGSAEYMLAKLPVVGAYGKTAQNPMSTTEVLDLNKKGIASPKAMADGDYKKEGQNYFYIAIFTTSLARNRLLTMSGLIGYDHSLYFDTDSNHTDLDVDQINEKLKDSEFHLSEYELGQPKIESTSNEVKYLREKAYIEKNNITNDVVVKVSGLGKEARAQIINLEDLSYDREYPVLTLNQFKGGYLLEEGTKTLSKKMSIFSK